MSCSLPRTEEQHRPPNTLRARGGRRGTQGNPRCNLWPVPTNARDKTEAAPRRTNGPAVSNPRIRACSTVVCSAPPCTWRACSVAYDPATAAGDRAPGRSVHPRPTQAALSLACDRPAWPRVGHLGPEPAHARAAKRFFLKLLHDLRYVPRVIVTDKLRSYGAGKRDILPGVEHRQSRYLNNTASAA